MHIFSEALATPKKKANDSHGFATPGWKPLV